MKFEGGVSGFKELGDVLRELPPSMQRNVLAGATRAGAQVAQREIKGATPVGEDRSEASKKYGRARDNVVMRRLRNVGRHVAGFRVSMGRAFWMTWYEFGTSRQPARPFFRPAFERASGQAFNAMTEALARGLDRQVKRLAQRYGSVRKAILRN